MIARLVPAAHFTVDTGSNKAFGQDGVEQEMIDAQPGVPRPSVPEIVPKSVDAFGGMQLAHGIYPALFERR